jgi:hypothetical protein
MIASRGMGAVNPNKMPKGVRKARRDNTDFTEYAKGGRVKKMSDGGGASSDEDEKPSKLNLKYKESESPLSLQGEIANDAYGGIGGGGRATYTKKLSKDSDVQAWLEGGGYKPKDQDYKGQVTNAGVRYNVRFKDGGDVWDKPNPAKKHTKLSSVKKAGAKAAAKAAGRPYPNLIDNMRAARKK